jgi:hypothetical protein
MYCPSCGTQNSDTNRFCMKCGTALPAAATPTPVSYAPRPAYAAASPNWRPVGWLTLAAAAISILGFFLPWLSLSTGLFGSMLGASSLQGGVSGWSLFFYNITTILPALFDSRSGGLRGMSSLPAGYAILLFLALIDLIAIVLVLIAGLVAAVHAYRLMNAAPSTDNAVQQRRLRRIRSNGIAGLVPAILFFLLIQGLLGFSFGGSFGGFGGGATLGLNIMGLGFWLSTIGLLVTIFARPLAAPK